MVNLGTPTAPQKKAVKEYLTEFLTDPRVIDTPWLSRQLLVRGAIIPKRLQSSLQSYRKIWQEDGSPLMVHSTAQKNGLQELLGDGYVVEIAMRYRFPSIEEALVKFRRAGIDDLTIVPLFPQYASATTGSVHQKIMEIIARWQVIPEIRFIKDYPVQGEMIRAFCDLAVKAGYGSYDHVVLSFHGLPQRQLLKADTEGHCFKKKGCCSQMCRINSSCYSAQCYATARAIAQGLGLDEGGYTVAFQSRLGKEPWIEPYTSDVLPELAKKGLKRVLVMCPAFVADCLETIFEIGVEYAHLFRENGGEELRLVEGLNGHPLWLEGLRRLVMGEEG